MLVEDVDRGLGEDGSDPDGYEEDQKLQHVHFPGMKGIKSSSDTLRQKCF